MFRPGWLRAPRPVTIRHRPTRVSRFIRPLLEWLEDRITPTGPITLQAADASSLQQAVQTADNNPTQQYVIQLTGTSPYNLTAELDLTNTAGVTITGSSSVLNAASASRVFLVETGANLTLQNLTVENGNVTEEGGGILDQGGNVTLSNVVVQNNLVQSAVFRVLNGGTPQAVRNVAEGGGVFVSGGALTVTNSVIRNNGAAGNFGISGAGGGVYASLATVNITNSVIDRNTAQGGSGNSGFNGGAGGNGGSGLGGGIFAVDGTLTILNSSLTNNGAKGGQGGQGSIIGVGGQGGNGQGGALYNSESTLQMINTTLSGNTAQGGRGGQGGQGGSSGGPGGPGGEGQGGGVFDNSLQSSYINNTVAHNTALAGGGGPAGTPSQAAGSPGSANGGGVFVTGSSTILTNNLLQANQAATSGPDYGGFVNPSDTNNFISNAGGVIFPANNIISSTPQLGPLTTAPNGTSYYPLLPFVQAINAGTNNVLSTIAGAEGVAFNPNDFSDITDQIGDPRVNGPAIDIGSVEFEGVPTNTAVASVNTTFSPAGQNVKLSATVTATGFTVNEGNVTFTVLDGRGNAIDGTVQGAVKNGQASALFAVPAGQAAGTYTIHAVYSDSSGNFQNSSGDGTLDIQPAATVTTVSSINAVFSPADQSVPLSATVTASGGLPVNEGQVQFVVTNSSGAQIGSPVTFEVINSAANGSFTLPGNTPPGTYTITATYSDPLGNYQGSTGTGTLTVVAASTVTTVSNVTASYSPADQSVTFSATVTANDGVPVNTGQVQFVLTNASGVPLGPPVTALVSNSQVSTLFTVPGNTLPGNYTITATYTDAANYQGSTGTGTLTIVAAATNTQVTNVTATFSPQNQSVTVSANVTAKDGVPINAGQVQFVITNAATGAQLGSTVTAPVVNGLASTSFTLPAGTSPGLYNILATFSDSSGKYQGSSGIGTSALSVEPAATTVTVSNVSVPFTNEDPVVTLSATVTTPSRGVPIPINEGQVQFVVTSASGAVLGQPVTAPVVNGQASAAFAVPASTPVGNYTITATFTDSLGNYQGSTGTGTLSVVPSPTTVTVNNVNIVYTMMGEQETLTAVVRNALGVVVNEGFVTFTEAGQTVTVPIVNSLATVTLNIPLFAENPFAHNISVAYGDNSGNFLASKSLFTIQETLMEFLIQMMAVQSLMHGSSGNA